jgi:F0F1-type ATP synthase membrane subunit b/b'
MSILWRIRELKLDVVCLWRLLWTPEVDSEQDRRDSIRRDIDTAKRH